MSEQASARWAQTPDQDYFRRVGQEVLRLRHLKAQALARREAEQRAQDQGQEDQPGRAA